MSDWGKVWGYIHDKDLTVFTMLFENKDHKEIYHIRDPVDLRPGSAITDNRFSHIELPITNFNYKNKQNNFSIEFKDIDTDYIGFFESIEIYPKYYNQKSKFTDETDGLLKYPDQRTVTYSLTALKKSNERNDYCAFSIFRTIDKWLVALKVADGTAISGMTIKEIDSKYDTKMFTSVRYYNNLAVDDKYAQSLGLYDFSANKEPSSVVEREDDMIFRGMEFKLNAIAFNYWSTSAYEYDAPIKSYLRFSISDNTLIGEINAIPTSSQKYNKMRIHAKIDHANMLIIGII